MRTHSNLSHKSILLIRCVSLIIVVSVILSVLAHGLVYLVGATEPKNVLTTVSVMKPKTWMLLATSCVLEEILFRGALSLSKRAIVVSTFSWLLVVLLYGSKIAMESTGASKSTLHIVSFCCVIFASVVAYLVHIYLVNCIRSILSNKYNLFFWICSLLFAVSHILNFTDTGHAFGIYLVLVVPQLVMGSILGIIRVQWGIFWSILVHFFVDAWLFLCVVVGLIKNEHILVTVCVVTLSFMFLYGMTQLRLARVIFGSLRNPALYLSGAK